MGSLETKRAMDLSSLTVEPLGVEPSGVDTKRVTIWKRAGIHRSSIPAVVYFDGFVPCLLLLSSVNRISIFGSRTEKHPPLPLRRSRIRWIQLDFLATFHSKYSISLLSRRFNANATLGMSGCVGRSSFQDGGRHVTRNPA